MQKTLTMAAVAILVSANGLMAEPAAQTAAGPTAPPVSAWPKPLLLPVKFPPSGTSKDWTQLSIVAGKGFVGGSPEAVSSIGQPLAGVQTRSRVLDVCKKALWDQASRSGAESIEGVSEDADQSARNGKIFAPVTMRLSYAKSGMFEVKRSTAICVVDRAGRFVDLYTPDPSYRIRSHAKEAGSPTTQWSRLPVTSRQ